jgi:hypothetical protein
MKTRPRTYSHNEFRIIGAPRGCPTLYIARSGEYFVGDAYGSSPLWLVLQDLGHMEKERRDGMRRFCGAEGARAAVLIYRQAGGIVLWGGEIN